MIILSNEIVFPREVMTIIWKTHKLNLQEMLKAVERKGLMMYDFDEKF